MPGARLILWHGRPISSIFPLETDLLAASRARGQRVANGVSMVVGQAAEVFRHITGIAPDRERMLARLLADIAGEQAA